MNSTRMVRLAAFVVLWLLLPRAVTAQGSGAVELGLDLSAGIISVEDYDDDLVQIAVPEQSFRAGFFLGDAVQLETRLAFLLLNFESETDYQLTAGAGLVYNFSSGGSTMPFLQAGGVVRRLNSFDEYTQYGLNGGLGVRLRTGEKFAVRLGGEITKFFEREGGVQAQTQIFGKVGFSFFTK